MVGSSTHFLRVYFNFAYYFSLVPFRFHRSKRNSKKIITNSSNLKKVICFLVHGFIAIGFLIESIRQFQTKMDQSLDFYFFVIRRLFSILYMFAFFETVWRHGAQFLHVLQLIDAEEDALVDVLPHYALVVKGLSKKRCQFNLSTRIFSTMACITYTIPAFLIISSAQLFTDNPSWNPHENIHLYANKARFAFLFQNIDTELPETIPRDMIAIDYILGIIYSSYQFLNYLRDYYSDLLLLNAVLTIRNLTRKFSNYLKENIEGNPTEICRKYNLIRKVTLEINEILRISFGLLLLQAPTQIMPVISENHQTVLAFLYGVLFTINFLIILVLSGGIIDDMSQMKQWIRSGNNSEKLQTPEFSIILDEIENCPFGIQGIGLPVITYNFVRIVVTLMASYAIIIVQLQSHEKCKCECNGTSVLELRYY